MSDSDELSPEDQARVNRDRRREDAMRAHHQAMSDIRRSFARSMQDIDNAYTTEMVAINALKVARAPKIIEVAHGMVLFG